jgi:hypothetical protein
MTENDFDPHLPPEEQSRPVLGGVPQPDAGDPTLGGKRGKAGRTAGVAADEPDDGSAFPVGGGDTAEESDAPPVSDSGPVT